MKNLPQSNVNKILTQDKINDLEEDLLTVLEAHIDDIETGELFYLIIRYVTVALYETAPDHREALRILRMGMDAGIKNHVDKKKGV
jgi:hypothetical protein